MKYFDMISRFAFAITLSVFFISCKNENTKFVKLSNERIGINFANTLIENDSVNIFEFANIYNGGGVGIGDFNNDGFQDIYFTANMVDNKLYLNKGNFKFEDITDRSNVNGKGNWNRGIAVVDINNDGWQDMYVCATAKWDPMKRINMLYINKGLDKNNIPVFEDMAAEYGLADTSQTTMAYFFDYDNDNDLDVFLGINHIIVDAYANTYRKRKLNGEHSSTGRLFRNDWNDGLKHPVYTDVSREAGILIEGFTHAANIFDINEDGWMDIQVLNDYVSSNVLYINNRNGTFTDSTMQYFKHAAANSMGSDAADLNNDGLEDVVEVDMNPQDNLRKKVFQNGNSYQIYQNSEEYGIQYQYIRNMIHVNMGNTMRHNDTIGHPVFGDIGFYSNTAETDWSWCPLVADYDHDGFKDIIFTNGFPRDITDRDFIVYRSEAHAFTSKEDMLKEVPQVKIPNYAYKNNGRLKFDDVTKDWGFETPSFSNGAAYADLDNDGDLDVIINNINDPAFVYENKLDQKENNYLSIKFKGSETNRNGIGAKVSVYTSNGLQLYTHMPYRGYLSTQTLIMNIGAGSAKIIDSLIVTWPDRKKQKLLKIDANQTIELNYNNAAGSNMASPGLANDNLFTEITKSSRVDYVHKQKDLIDFNIQKLLPHKFSEYSPGIAAGDINGDGMDDFVTGGSPGFSAVIFIQHKSGTFEKKPLMGNFEIATKQTDDRGILLFDADKDNDLDLLITAGGYSAYPNSIEYTDVLYINDGKGNFSPLPNALPANLTSKFCIRACDYDKDNDMDLFIAGRMLPRNYPQSVSSFIYRNDTKDGVVKFTDVTKEIAPVFTDIGLVCDGIWTDFDNDGWVDIMLAGEWMPLRVFKNEKGKFSDVTDQSGIKNYAGWWNSITGGDFDNDGDIDYIAGNLGENSFLKASDQYPLHAYVNDFDGNKTTDCVITRYILDRIGGTLKEFPVHTRDDVVDQMPFIKKRMLSYKLFGASTIDKIFTPEELGRSVKLTANYMSTSFIRNNGNGTFAIQRLNDICQFSMINGMITGDFNGDGNLDVCMNTNDYGTEVGNGRYDALNGILLQGDGKGSFHPLKMTQSGISLTGNGKGLALVYNNSSNCFLIATENKGPIRVFKSKRSASIIKMLPGDAYCMLNFSDGRKQKAELYHGSSFLSQSSRLIILPPGFASCEITDWNGKKRLVTP